MSKLTAAVALFLLMAVAWPRTAVGQAVEEVPSDSSPTAASPPFLLGPPRQEGPVVVRARFDLYDINEIDDHAERFEFVGALTLVWRDPRQAFDPAVAGVEEKIFQGDFQFNEIAPGWYPQVILVNESGLYETNGVILRVRPDGTSSLVQTVNAAAEVRMNMRDFPFDEQQLNLMFEVLGFGRDEVRLQPEAHSLPVTDVQTPQWDTKKITVSERERLAAYAGRAGAASVFVVSIDVARQSWYVRQLIILPLVVIVLLSFSVFWMDRSSLGDRVNVSFIGILTGVAYQIVMSDRLPQISYFTLIHAFLGWSFLAMCSTVVINLVVGRLDQRGKNRLGDRVDWHCRWIFPLVYFGPIIAMLGWEFF